MLNKLISRVRHNPHGAALAIAADIAWITSLLLFIQILMK